VIIAPSCVRGEEVRVATVEGARRREFLIARGWIQAVVLPHLHAHPPVPARVVDQNGSVLFTGSDIRAGQQVFLHNG
jgi:nitric oxide reductase subunit B